MADVEDRSKRSHRRSEMFLFAEIGDERRAGRFYKRFTKSENDRRGRGTRRCCRKLCRHFRNLLIRLRPKRKDHVWSYDFVVDRLSDGRPFRTLNIIDEWTRECLSITVNHQLTAQDVLNQLYSLFIMRRVPDHIRSDNGSEFTAKAVRELLANVGVKTLFIDPGSPWENGYIESFNGKFRNELLSRELFTTLTEAKVLIETWRREYNQIRPHSSLGYRPPAPEAIQSNNTTLNLVQ